ncbi:MAG: cytochrome c biogenesis protein ResB [Planctomycetota bacterium]|jgi:hypothetical protein
MNILRRVVMWLALVLVILLIFLSIYGAFVGAEQAKRLFNSLPLTVYWFALAVVLIVALALFRRLMRVPALLLMHVGSVLIIGGSLWGSDAGHKIQKRLFKINKIPKGRMLIFEGQQENIVRLGRDQRVEELPFQIRLKDFSVHYYQPQYLRMQMPDGQSREIPVEIGAEFSLAPDVAKVTVLRAFENFKITIEGDQRTVVDAPPPGYNPALEVKIEYPDGQRVNRYVFERFGGHGHPGDKFTLSYRRVIRDYISELQVIKDNKVVAKKSIEVNHPLHFGGYHFYQYNYDKEAHQYTILEVVSDSGLNLVYAGYLMLIVGVFWHLWLRELGFGKDKSESEYRWK